MLMLFKLWLFRLFRLFKLFMFVFIFIRGTEHLCVTILAGDGHGILDESIVMGVGGVRIGIVTGLPNADDERLCVDAVEASDMLSSSSLSEDDSGGSGMMILLCFPSVLLS